MSGLESLIRGARIPHNWQFTPEQMTEIIAAKFPGARAIMLEAELRFTAPWS
jgi:hypothetical protein